MTMFYDGHKPVWQEHQDYPWNEYKHLDREKFEELVTMMINAYPDHDITEWLKRGFAMNEGDSTISFSSLEGYKMLQWGINHFDLEDAVKNIVSLWDEKFKDDPYWIINPDGELGWYGCDEFESCYEQLMEHFDYEFPDIDELIEEFDFDEKLIFSK